MNRFSIDRAIDFLTNVIIVALLVNVICFVMWSLWLAFSAFVNSGGLQ